MDSVFLNNAPSLPHGFLWGAATSSFQIEGEGSGRGLSIWDTFAATPGRIKDGSDGKVACDHFHRWPEDLDLMADMGLGAYRFSVAWPRVLPEGTGAVSEQGLDFYDRLVDGLLARGIQPFVTLFHWDLPQVLEDRGGWPNRATAEAFVGYTQVVAERLSDRVTHWMTHNEPWCASHLGYREGVHAPGRKDWRDAIVASHHLLLSHGLAAQVLRSISPRCKVGIALNLSPVHAATDRESDLVVARQFDGELNRWFLDPIFRGTYPQDVIEHHIQEGRLPEGTSFVRPGDLETIAQPVDFVGVNYYSRAYIDTDPASGPTLPDAERTDMGWEIYPEGLHEILVRLHQDWGPSEIYVTENGCAYGTAPDAEGRVADTDRIRYLRRHLTEVARAAHDGVPLRGYFCWSLLDNFEWAEGYAKRFGLVWVDYETQARILKDSARWYRRAVSANAVVPERGED